MKNSFLFPNKLKPLGWLLFTFGFLLGAVYLIWHYEIPGFSLKLRGEGGLFKGPYENFTNELALVLVVSGLLITGFAKEKVEDELIAKIRANSLYWAILVGAVVKLVFVMFQIAMSIFDGYLMPGEPYLMFFIPLLLFKFRFQYLIHRKDGVYTLDNLYYLPKRPYRLIAILLSVPLICITIYCISSFFVPNFLAALANLTSLPLIIWVYTREDKEDEFIASLRVRSMQLAVIGYYCFLLVANMFLYFITFLYTITLSIEITAVIFLITFNWQLRRYKVAQGGLAL